MEKELQKIQYPRGTQDYSKSRMRENRKYGSVRGGQSNLGDVKNFVFLD